MENNIIMKEKIVNILINELCYCDCDNCEYNYKYQADHCEDCHKIDWKLSKNAATEIADQILKEVIYNFENLINKIN